MKGKIFLKERWRLGATLLAWACSKIPYCGGIGDYMGILDGNGFEFYLLSLDRPGYNRREWMGEVQIGRRVFVDR